MLFKRTGQLRVVFLLNDQRDRVLLIEIVSLRTEKVKLSVRRLSTSNLSPHKLKNLIFQPYTHIR